MISLHSRRSLFIQLAPNNRVLDLSDDVVTKFSRTDSLLLGNNYFHLFACQILSARDMAQKTVIGQDRIVYTTDKDIIEQDVEAREWDQRFREIEKSD